MIESLSQKEIVDYLLEDDWVVENDETSIQNFKVALNRIQCSELIHYFVCNFNHDCGIEELQYILEHPKLDKSSALALYWMSAPGYFQQYESIDEVPEYEKEKIESILKIHLHLESACKINSKIIFNPTDDREIDWTNEYRKEMKALLNKGKEPFYKIPVDFFNAV